MHILVINGPNLNLLGIREPAVYGDKSYEALCACVRQACAARGVSCEIVQSNHEGVLVDTIQAAYAGGVDGIIINPAAYTHTSIAIPDALKAVGIPAVEVHLTDIREREPYRRVSYTASACLESICGQGFAGYEMAVALLCRQHGRGDNGT